MALDCLGAGAVAVATNRRFASIGADSRRSASLSAVEHRPAVLRRFAPICVQHQPRDIRSPGMAVAPPPTSSGHHTMVVPGSVVSTFHQEAQQVHREDLECIRDLDRFLFLG